MSNLLPHKSWHIWRKDNLDRIERDEAEERRKEQEKKERASKAAQAERLELLRKRARGSQGADEVGAAGAAGGEPAEEHVNLFFVEEQEAGRLALTQPNADRAAEEATLKRKQERRLTAYLGDGSAELSEKKPWYWNSKADNDDSPLDPKRRRSEAAALQRADPRTEMQKQVAALSRASEDAEVASRRAGKHSADGLAATSTKDKLARLRAERLQREEEERARVAKILGVESPVEAEQPVGRYYSQFNPQFDREKRGQHHRRHHRR